jgi:hypothetical protein
MTQPIIPHWRAQYAPALQRSFITIVDATRPPRRPFPTGLTGGDLNILDPAAPVFAPWTLLSWGQFINSPAGVPPGIVGSRDRKATKLIADSGGFQFIGAPHLFTSHCTVFAYLGWAETHADVAMTMDIPTRAIGKGRWNSFQDCLDDTLVNLKDFSNARTNDDLTVLNVLQGRDWQECLAWYDAVKHYPFDGWAFGGGSRDLLTMTRLIARMVKENRLGRHLHVLGTSSLQRAVELTAIKMGLGQYGEAEVTFDTATPSMMAANGLILTGAKWTSFTSEQARLPLDPQLSGSPFPFPATGTYLGGRLTLGEILTRDGLSQSGLDSTGHALLTHHNTEQLLRNIEEANRWADLVPGGGQLNPPGLAQRIHDVYAYLGAYAPEKTIGGHLKGFRDVLDDEWQETSWT